jgi:hypothetical protein
MGEFRYTPQSEVAERHRTPRPVAAPRTKPYVPRQRNVEAVLTLGGIRYLSFRNRVYSVQPVSFKFGQRLAEQLDVINAIAQTLMIEVTPKERKRYYAELARMGRMLWPHMRPTGHVRRLLKRLRLLHNPLTRDASESEITDVCAFFLQGRMTSSVQPLSEIPALEIPTF